MECRIIPPHIQRAAALLLCIFLSACGLFPEPLAQAPVANESSHAVAVPAAAAPDFGAQLQEALRLRHNGALEESAELLATIVNAGPGEQTRLAQYYLGENFARRGRWSSALAMFDAVSANGQSDTLAAQALFWQARAHESAGSHQSAIEYYTKYAALQAPAATYALMRSAAQYQALGQLAEAAAAYEQVGDSTITPGERAGSYEKAIALYLALGRANQALELYPRLIELANQPEYRGRILAEAASLADQLADAERARNWWNTIIRDAPQTAYAQQAVDRLRNDPLAGLDPAAAGRIYLSAERWADAVALFDLAISANPPAILELRRLRALALRGLGQLAEARAEFDAVSALDPGSATSLQARLDSIQTLGWLGDVAGAEAGYRALAAELATDNPDSNTVAIEALRRVVELRERAGDAEAAALARVELGRRGASSLTGQRLLHQAGLFYYGTGRPAQAAEAWQLLGNANTGYERARGLFWAGRALRDLGDTTAAGQAFTAAAAAAPDSYYGVRAAEELGPIPDGQIAPGTPIDEAGWTRATEWVESWALARDPASDPWPALEAGAVARAIELQAVGLQVESINEWNTARDQAADDPRALLQLARQAHQANVPYIALLTAQQLVRLAPENGTTVPDSLRQLIYPAPWAELMLSQAREFGLDPRALLSTFRQESLFNPDATSWVGARGLGQVMPDTGRGIATNLGYTDFDIDLLYRPQISIRFGAFYLGTRVRDMQGSLHGALAAYNGGLGNAQRWAGGSLVADPDWFAETIDFAETQGYVKSVYGFYGAYRRLYSP